jgi:hypothetical protein
MTKAGTINTQSVKMFRESVRSVGISLLGGNSGVEGPYELGIDEIRAVNEEDVTVEPSMFNYCLERVLDFILYCSGSFNDAGTNMNSSTISPDLLPHLMSSVTTQGSALLKRLV